ncbi:MAG: 6-phosphofructokinase [Clostridia bacterium]|nr:6-phosphofructokinase [Clostridia bacterium]
MEQLIGACLVGQSGGPTSVINASAYGVIRTALDNPNITRVLGAAHGVKGILEDKLYDMDLEDEKELSYLLNTPSSALGSCRYKLKDSAVDDTDYRRLLEVFKKHNIRYFFYIGGNDSMDTCNKISKFMQAANYPCRVMGVPKTIDNDLFGTDHCPGFASAAKYVITSCMELRQDSTVYDYPTVCIVEIMGRHAGWLAASSAVATAMGSGPDLVYLPERDFDMDSFLSDVKRVMDEKNGECMIAVSEGIHDKDGVFIAEYGAAEAALDSFGHKQLGGVASTLVSFIKEKLGVSKIRGIELSLLQRCAAHCASATDINESFAAGRAAVNAAVAGETDKMMTFRRTTDENGNYRCDVVPENLSLAANTEKKVPQEWINAEGNGVTQQFVDYILPLIQGTPEIPMENGLPRYARLKKVLAD